MRDIVQALIKVTTVAVACVIVYEVVKDVVDA